MESELTLSDGKASIGCALSTSETNSDGSAADSTDVSMSGVLVVFASNCKGGSKYVCHRSCLLPTLQRLAGGSPLENTSPELQCPGPSMMKISKFSCSSVA